MSPAVQNLTAAFERAFSLRPATGGFPYLAEVLRQAGVRRNIWHLPAAEALYLTELGPVVQLGQPVASGMVEVPAFRQDALVTAIRRDQAGLSTFPEFLAAAWQAGVIGYEADFVARTVVYRGANGEQYLEPYPAVALP